MRRTRSIRLFARLAPLGALVALLLASAPAAQARLETLRWTHPDPSSVAGFRVYARFPSESFGAPSFDGLPTPVGGVYIFDLEVPDGASVHVALTAYNDGFFESEFSNEQLRDAPPPPEPDPVPVPDPDPIPDPDPEPDPLPAPDPEPTPDPEPELGAPYRLNAGGSAFTDPDGNAWQTDTPFVVNAGSRTWTVDRDIANTDLEALYRTQRWQDDDSHLLTYALPVEPGRYRVRLHFAETYQLQAGERVFDVRAESALVIEAYDIVAEVGLNAATSGEFVVYVSDGELTIEFFPVVGKPRVEGIEVLEMEGDIPVPLAPPAAPRLVLPKTESGG